MAARIERYCDVCEESMNTKSWSKHQRSQIHLRNVATSLAASSNVTQNNNQYQNQINYVNNDVSDQLPTYYYNNQYQYINQPQQYYDQNQQYHPQQNQQQYYTQQ